MSETFAWIALGSALGMLIVALGIVIVQLISLTPPFILAVFAFSAIIGGLVGLIHYRTYDEDDDA